MLHVWSTGLQRILCQTRSSCWITCTKVSLHRTATAHAGQGTNGQSIVSHVFCDGSNHSTLERCIVRLPIFFPRNSCTHDRCLFDHPGNTTTVTKQYHASYYHNSSSITPSIKDVLTIQCNYITIIKIVPRKYCRRKYTILTSRLSIYTPPSCSQLIQNTQQ